VVPESYTLLRTTTFFNVAVAGNTISLMPTSTGSEEEGEAGEKAIEDALEASAANQQVCVSCLFICACVCVCKQI
jgi:hypothetical protein